jgi:hypothetical protein
MGGMKRKTIESMTFLSAALLAILLGSYPAGYFCLGEKRVGVLNGGGTLRVYPNESIARMYYPVSVVEWWLTRKKVLLGSY